MSGGAEVIFRGGTILTIDPRSQVLAGDVALRDGVIVHVGGAYVPATSSYDVVDCTGMVVMPGLVQAHVHLCQTLARGHADDLELLDWLAKVIWPYEAALDAPAMGAAAALGCAELLLGGTTAILDMGSVHHYDEVFQVAERAGLRLTGGKAMMDADDPLIPAGLREPTSRSLDESERLIARWHGAAGGRLRYAYAPRFVLSCTEALLREVGRRAAAPGRGLRIHTHASENQAELAEVRRRHNADNLDYLASLGIAGPHCTIAHCIHVDERGRARLAADGTHVCHCPSSNLKLASGIAAVPELLAAGVSVALGADGAPCGNNLDGLLELRLAALLHKPGRGPRTLPASAVVRMATMGGARALGLDAEVGSLEVGKRGDVIAIDAETLHATPTDDPYSLVAYAARGTDVRHVAVDGTLVVRDRQLLTMDVGQVRRDARAHATRLFPRG
jgi:5-methylthioadenosine/S-adenosylhomocysteine deaminase